MSGGSDYADPNGSGADDQFDTASSAASDDSENVVASVDDLQSELDLDPGMIRAERDEYLDSLRRLQAEFDNYRKRMVRQQTDLLERSTEALLVRLLPVLDAVDLALDHAGDSPADVVINFTQIAGLLRDTVLKEGLERIDETGVSFDPTIHDAVAHEARTTTEDQADESESGRSEASGAHETRVIEVLRPGYRLKGKVLRPAMVKVEG